MQRRIAGAWQPVALIMALLLISACAMTQTNVGKTATKGQRIAIDIGTTGPDLWQTREVAVAYTIMTTPDTISLKGSVTIMDWVTSSFPLPDFFNLYLNVLDGEGRVLETHNIKPNIGYRNDIPKHLNISATIAKPPQAMAVAFSYFGLFRGSTGDESTGEWEIYFSPFQ